MDFTLNYLSFEIDQLDANYPKVPVQQIIANETVWTAEVEFLK